MLLFESTTYRETIYREIRKMNPSLGLKLLLIRHGKCSACKDIPKDKAKPKHCPVCFNTRLEPGVLEAITALDLGAKFKENEKLSFENISDDDYPNPSQVISLPQLWYQKHRFPPLLPHHGRRCLSRAHRRKAVATHIFG
jgi:hypothetical protein